MLNFSFCSVPDYVPLWCIAMVIIGQKLITEYAVVHVVAYNLVIWLVIVICLSYVPGCTKT